MLSKSHPIILFIDRNGFSVYQDILANITKFNFTPDLVVNLDVVNKEQFASLISTFIQVNKIVGSSLAVILSDNVIYIRDLVNPQKPIPEQSLKTDSDGDKEHKDEVQNFLENVPFEEVLAKVIKTGNVDRIVAVNKDLAMTIINAFVDKGSSIEAITPSFIFGQNANFTAGLTLDNVKIILEDVETLKSGNLLTNQERIVPSQNLESGLKNLPTSEVKKPKNLRQYILIGVFAVLLIILAVVFLSMGNSQTSSPNSKAKNIPVSEVAIPTTPPVSEPTLTQALITSAPLDLKSIKVKITQSSQADEKAVNLKEGLLKIGFQDIVSEISEVSVPEKSSVVFSQNIPADLRNNIIVEIKKILPDISILENQDSNFTINILIGKS